MPEKDEPKPYNPMSPIEQSRTFMDSLGPLGFYKPFEDRLRELNARFMSNDKKEGETDQSL